MSKKKKTGKGNAGLPETFVAWWRALCKVQGKTRSMTWRYLLREWLIAGRVIPGYGTDWRGIWLAENGGVVPNECPYSDNPGDRKYPKGWGYANILVLALNERRKGRRV